ncbi:MAG: hypothetical protein IKZ30_01345, partial [Oscillospiraceae bacterium]|nr:hypothetical protein [Oscillospiraceae bacterium]
MRAAAKMMMTRNATSRNESENEMNERRSYRNEGYGRGYSEGYEDEAEGGMEMRRRRDRRGRFMEGENEMEMRRYSNEMYRNEGGMRSEGYREENYNGKIIRPSDHAPGFREGDGEEYPKPYLLPRKDMIGFHSA